MPVTFPASLDQLPRPVLDGYDELEPSFSGEAPSKDASLIVDYDIEGSDVGYRWNAAKGLKALFPLGFGLSYTTFSSDGLKTDGKSATITVRNTGARDGAEVAQLYLVSRNGQRKLRLVGFQRVELKAGEARQVAFPIDPRILADWRDGGWSIPGGDYVFAIGQNAETLGQTVTVRMRARNWRD